MCFASGRQVFFSDQNKPNSIKVLNVIDVPSEGEISAIVEQNGNLLIFTDNETWFYQPSLSDLLSGGKLTRISESVGCVGPNSVQKIDNNVVFVDSSGIYTNPGNLSISKMSTDVNPFFTDSMPNPLTSAFLTLGSPGDSSQYYDTSLSAKLSGVKTSYSADLDALIVCFPELNGALCSTSNKWSWWSFDSMSTSDGEPGVTQNIPLPWILSSQTDLFMIAGPDIQALTDGALARDGSALCGNTTSRSFFICRYGRGGGIDRSIGENEDDRFITGRWRSVNLANNPLAGAFYFDEPTKIDSGFNFIEHGAGATTTRGQAGERDYFLPISVAITSAVGPWSAARNTNYNSATTPPGDWLNYVELIFGFDSTNWEPVIESGATTDVVYDLPTERLPTNYNYSITDWSVHRSNSSGTPSASGGYIAVVFDGRSGLSGHVYNGSMNAPINRRTPLIRVAMRKLSSTSDLSGMAIEPVQNYSSVGRQPDPGALETVLMPSFVFDKWAISRNSVRDRGDTDQPVDWAYRSPTVGMGEGREVKFRGIYADVLSHGAGTEKVQPSWQYGLMSTIASSDRRDLAAQVLDITDNPASGSTNNRTRVKQQSSYTGTPPAASSAFSAKDTIRKTVRSELSGNPTIEKVFNSDGSVVYSGFDASGTTSGNVLIGDEEVNQVAISMGVKGQSFNVTMFGFIRNKAERLFIEGARAAFRVVGGRRRKGR